MRLLRSSALGVLVLAAVALAPTAVLADDDHGVAIKGTFAASFMRPAAPSPVTGPYCASGGIPIEAQGIGNVSKVGPLFLTVKKCATVVGSAVTYAGTFTMTAGNGDNLHGTYAGTQDNTLRDENGYVPFQGTLTFTGGRAHFTPPRAAPPPPAPPPPGGGGGPPDGKRHGVLQGKEKYSRARKGDKPRGWAVGGCKEGGRPAARWGGGPRARSVLCSREA